MTVICLSLFVCSNYKIISEGTGGSARFWDPPKMLVTQIWPDIWVPQPRSRTHRAIPGNKFLKQMFALSFHGWQHLLHAQTLDAREMGQERFPCLCRHSVSDRIIQPWQVVPFSLITFCFYRTLCFLSGARDIPAVAFLLDKVLDKASKLSWEMPQDLTQCEVKCREG